MLPNGGEGSQKPQGHQPSSATTQAATATLAFGSNGLAPPYPHRADHCSQMPGVRIWNTPLALPYGGTAVVL